MAETSIQKARRLARESREARERAEAAEAEARAEAEKEEPEEEGFFSSFFGRGDTIDDAIDKATGRQHTDEANK